MLENLYENRLSKSYLSNGYVIEKSDERKTLDEIKLIFINNINKILPKTKSRSDDYTLNYLHKFITIKEYDNYKKCFSSEYKKPKMAKTGNGNSVWYNWIP